MEPDPIRLKVLKLLKDRGSDLRKASLAMGATRRTSTSTFTGARPRC